MTRTAAALAHISRAQIIADTCELIAGMGENPGGTEAETVRRIRAMSERIGAQIEEQEIAPGRPNISLSLGPIDAPAVLFLGHSDVVPAGEGWTADPFDPRVTDTEIIGRGATDMKGGIAAALAAMSAVHEVAPELRLELLCTVDEEDRAQGVQAWLATHAPRSYLGCIVAEPTDMEIVIGCRGAANLNVSVVGAAAHAGRPEDGASSIYAASRIVELVRGQHDAARRAARDPLLGGASWNVGTISGGSGTSIVPHVTELTIDRRTMPGEIPEEILAELLTAARRDLTDGSIANAASIELRGSVDMAMPGFRTDEDAALVRVASRTLSELQGSASITGWTAACEGGFIAQHHRTPVVILGPGDITAQAHQPDERVSIAQLDLAARAYAQIALELAAEHEHEHEHQAGAQQTPRHQPEGEPQK